MMAMTPIDQQQMHMMPMMGTPLQSPMMSPGSMVPSMNGFNPSPMQSQGPSRANSPNGGRGGPNDKCRFEVFVGKLPMGTTDDMLQEIAGPFTPTSVRVLMKPDKHGNFCGFVTFEYMTNAEAFINAVNGQVAFQNGDPLNVKFADGKSRKKLFIGGLAHGTTDEDLRMICEPFGVVLGVNILQKDNCVPCGFVSYESLDQANACISTLHDQPNRDCTKNYVVRMVEGRSKGGEDGEDGSGGNRRGGKGKGRGKRGYNKAFNANGDDSNNRVGTPPSRLMSPNVAPMQMDNMHQPHNQYQLPQQAYQAAPPQSMMMPPHHMHHQPGQQNLAPPHMMVPQQQQQHQPPMMIPGDNQQVLNDAVATGNTKIFVGWLPEQTHDYQVMSFMALFGDVMGLKICGKEQNKPCAIVQFGTPEQAANAVAYLNNLYLPGNPNPLVAKPARQ